MIQKIICDSFPRKGIAMRKLCIVLLALSFLMIGTVAYAQNAPSESIMLGGWQETESSVIPDEVQTALDKAMLDINGVDYKSVAYLGYQVVAGKNHCMLCRANVIYPNARPYYALVYFYEDLDGNSEVTNIVKIDIAGLSEKRN